MKKNFFNKKICICIIGGAIVFFAMNSNGCGKKDDILLTISEVSDQKADILDADLMKSVTEETKEPETEVSGNNMVQSDESMEVLYDYIHVCGAVKRPGVYKVPQGSHVFEIVYLAGGFLDTADENFINQAEIVYDREQLYIPTKKEVERADISPNVTEDNGKTLLTQEKSTEQITQEKLVTQENLVGEKETQININTATKEQLCELPGIGESRAEDIITYREQNGAFMSIEDIKKVKGIKDGMYSKIKNLITV